MFTLINREIAPGVLRSHDGLRQVRLTNSDIAGGHWPNRPHLNFEQGRTINVGGRYSFIRSSNIHVILVS